MKADSRGLEFMWMIESSVLSVVTKDVCRLQFFYIVWATIGIY
jgi:hypothetical protein